MTQSRRLRQNAPALRPIQSRDLHELVECVRWLADDQELREALATSAALSENMVEWALRTSVETLDVECLEGLRQASGLDGWSVNHSGLCATVLAGNVFTACIRALVIPLALGVPVIAKASPRDDVLAHALVNRLPAPFRACAHVTTFSRVDTACTEALLAHADVVHAYGSDASLREIRAMAPGATLFVPHGHGVGVAVLGHAPRGDALDSAMESLALDVAAYDQRGCLSPVEVWVLSSDPGDIAQRLSAALSRMEVRLPRGPQNHDVASACATWRDVAASLGELHEGPTHTVVACDGALPSSPGSRHIVVRPMTEQSAAARLEAFGPAIKAIGYAPLPNAAVVPLALPPGVAPRCSPLGTMQTPPFDAPMDGRPAWLGLTKIL